MLEVRSRRVGGATYQVPVEVPARRARTLAVRWLVEFARSRREKTMAQRLANELLDAQSQQGGAYKRKDDIFRMARPTRPSPTTAGRMRCPPRGSGTSARARRARPPSMENARHSPVLRAASMCKSRGPA